MQKHDLNNTDFQTPKAANKGVDTRQNNR